jgi:hypothetical protein
MNMMTRHRNERLLEEHRLDETGRFEVTRPSGARNETIRRRSIHAFEASPAHWNNRTLLLRFAQARSEFPDGLIAAGKAAGSLKLPRAARVQCPVQPTGIVNSPESPV